MKYAVICGLLFGGLVLFLGTQKVDAVTSYRPFGGSVTSVLKATNVQTIENTNYRCVVPGTSFTQRPVTGTTNYLVPGAITSRTGTTARSNSWVLGLYSQSITTITCIFQGTPPHTTTTTLNPIFLYGTSR